MTYKNNAMLTKRELLLQICKLSFADTLEEEIDKLPLIMRPREKAPLRCCVYKDRAVIRSKLLPIMGIETSYDDEFTPLSKYASEALQREEPKAVSKLSVVEEACRSCIQVNYTVTNVCKACDGRFCELNCPKNAISMKDGKAHIDETKCVNCGICEKSCPFHAVVYQPVPCMEVCPADAIEKDAEGHAVINHSKCIQCGKCLMNCPFGAIMEHSQLIDVIKKIKAKENIIALVAPALAGQFQANWTQVLKGIEEIGFQQVVEVALGADICAKNEAEEWSQKKLMKQSFMTTSCCSAYTSLVSKHIPELKEFVSHTKTPLQYTVEEVRKQNPDAKLVFISPCISKRSELEKNPDLDFILSFEELASLLIAKNIEVGNCEEAELARNISSEGRCFSYSGGVTEAVSAHLGFLQDELKLKQVDGISKKVVKELKRIKPDKVDFNFMEVMSCEGGCVNGCSTIAKAPQATRQIKKFNS